MLNPVQIYLPPHPSLDSQPVLYDFLQKSLKVKTAPMSDKSSLSVKSAEPASRSTDQNAIGTSIKPMLFLQFGNPDPPYPEEALENSIEGRVTVVLKIAAKTGIIQEIEVTKKSHLLLIESVLNTIKKWRFQPIGHSELIFETFHFDFCLE